MHAQSRACPEMRIRSTSDATPRDRSRGDAAHQDRGDDRAGDVGAGRDASALLHAGADVVRLNAAHGDPRDTHGTGRSAARDRGTSDGVGRRARRPARDRSCAPARSRATRSSCDVGTRVHAHRRRRSSATSTASRRRSPSSRAGSRPATRCSSPTARSCCASTQSTATTSCAESCAAACCARARACTCRAPKRTSSRSPKPTRSRSRWRSRSRPTSWGCRSCAAPKTSKPCAPGCPKRGREPQLVAKIETAVALDHLARHRAARRRGDGGARRSRHPGAGPARAADPEGDHPVLQHVGEAGDHRDADARVDDRVAAADARRGERRRQRGDRRHRRADAVGGDRGRRCIPTDAVRTMAEVAEAAEAWPRGSHDARRRGAAADDDRVAWAVAHAAVQAAEDLASPRSCARRRAARPRAGSPRSARRCRSPASRPRPRCSAGSTLVWGVRPHRDGRRRRHRRPGAMPCAPPRDAGSCRRAT